MLVCFYEAVFEADLSMGLWRPPKECTHECSQPSLLLLCRNRFLTGQTGFINFSNCKNRFNQQTSSSQSYFWIQPFKTVLASWAYYIVRMMLLTLWDTQTRAGDTGHWSFKRRFPKITRSVTITEKAPTRAFSWFKDVKLGQLPRKS